ncbi:DUF2247 family protein [Priestia aryabhattai]|uniref:DUF2247 family protein n=1 Tax=Priestia aryabhattai TaxID=412384 RepID=UPI001594494C
MKYSIEVLKQQNIPYSWDTLYVGLEIGVIDYKDLMHYAIEYLEVVPDVEDTNILELAWGFEETNDKRVLIGMLKECNMEEILQEGDKFEGETRKWRYGILESLKKSYRDDVSTLLKAVAEVYADCQYPSEMKSFIYYLPPDDEYCPEKHSDIENTNRLVLNLNSFLEREKNYFKTS